MRVLVGLILLLAMADHSSATYCLCRDGVGEKQLQTAIDYACGTGADCGPIQTSGACFQPNTVKAHCDWAVNSYFQRKGQVTGSCDFSGSATPSANPPSTVASGCAYPSSPSNTGTPTGTTPTGTTPTGTTPTGTTPTGLTPPGGTTNSGGFPGTPGVGPSGSGFTDPNDAVALSTNSFFIALTFWLSGLLLLVQ